MIALTEATAEAVTTTSEPEAQPATTRRRDHHPDDVRYIKLAKPIAVVGRARPVTRLKVTIDRGPNDGSWIQRSPRLRRGLYLSIASLFDSDVPTGQLLLCDHTGREMAYFAPVPLRRDGVPAARDWPNILEAAQAILTERDPFDTVPLEYLGWLPIKGVPRDRLVAVDPLAPEPQLLDTPTNVVRHQRFGPGLHVAPFRGPKGELLVVAIGKDGGLDAMWPVTGIDKWSLFVERPQLPDDWRSRVTYAGHGPDQWFDVDVDDRLVASDTSLGFKYQNTAYPRRDVVHVCPWLGRVNRTAHMVCATNALLCAQGFSECVDVNDGIHDLLGFLADIRKDAEHPNGVPDPIQYDPELEKVRLERERERSEAISRQVAAHLGGMVAGGAE